MKLRAIFSLFRDNKKGDSFSDVLLRAPEGQREELFKEAARQANEEQRKIFEQSRVNTPAS